jgi:ABC-2 type transport system ATP-binding protein
VIEVDGLTKRYGATTAVDGLSFTVRPGTVTGFLGPNGSGKSTTMRMIVGLDRPGDGRALVNGRLCCDLPAPLREVGVMLDGRAYHPGRSARAHLMALARANAIGPRRVSEVLETVGLAAVAGRRAGTFSLGMAQRLGIAAALLGDPSVLLLDEPVNGLDPEGIRWIRDLVRSLAAEGRCVLISSHLISEMALTADALVVIGRGRLLAELSMTELSAMGPVTLRVRTPTPDRLTAVLLGVGAPCSSRARSSPCLGSSVSASVLSYATARPGSDCSPPSSSCCPQRLPPSAATPPTSPRRSFCPVRSPPSSPRPAASRRGQGSGSSPLTPRSPSPPALRCWCIVTPDRQL